MWKSSEKHVVKWSASFIKLNPLSRWMHFFRWFHERTRFFVINSRWKQILNGSLLKIMKSGYFNNTFILNHFCIVNQLTSASVCVNVSGSEPIILAKWRNPSRYSALASSIISSYSRARSINMRAALFIFPSASSLVGGFTSFDVVTVVA